MNLQRSIKVLLGRKGKNQKDLAAGIGVSPAALSGYIHGTIDMPISKLTAMAEWFGVEEYILLYEGRGGK